MAAILSSLVAAVIARTTISFANTDDKVVIMTTAGFQWLLVTIGDAQHAASMYSVCFITYGGATARKMAYRHGFRTIRLSAVT